MMQTENASLKATVVAQNNELQELKRLAAQQTESDASLPSASPALDPRTMQQMFQQYCHMLQQMGVATPPLSS